MRIVKNDQEIRSVEEWFRHAPPRGGQIQWRDGRSAKELAKAWCPEGAVPGVPLEISELLTTQVALDSLELEWVEPEARVHFDNVPGEPRNADLVAVGEVGQLRVALSVEAKADEPFGQAVVVELSAAVHRVAHDEGRGKLNRILKLADALFSPRRGGEPRLGEIRYQLLTATAGTLAFAAQHSCPVAVFLIHEFLGPATNPGRVADNTRDLDHFVWRMTRSEHTSLAPGQLIGPLDVGGHPWGALPQTLYIGKARRNLDLAAQNVVAREPDLFTP